LAAENKAGEYRLPEAGRKLRLAQNIFFYAKQILAAVGSLLLVIAITSAIIVAPQPPASAGSHSLG
jgi:hypothetical protein